MHLEKIRELKIRGLYWVSLNRVITVDVKVVKW